VHACQNVTVHNVTAVATSSEAKLLHQKVSKP